jgi:nucleoside-diphosphate-sugar epimerase
MRVLLLGSSGFIGQATQKACHKSGMEVYGLCRTSNASNQEICISLIGDRDDSETVAKLIDELQINCVIDFRAMSIETSAPLIAAIAKTKVRYILISSCDVYRNFGLIHRHQSGPFMTMPIVEESPLRSNLYLYKSEINADPAHPEHWRQTYDKIPIEDYLKNNHDNWSILRLPMVYGPGCKSLRFDWALRSMIQDRPTLYVPRRWLDWTTTYAFVGNIGAAIALAANTPKAQNQIFNLGDTKPMPHTWWLEILSKQTGWRGNVILDDDLNSQFAKATSKLDLSYDFDVSSDKLKDFLSFEPPFTLEQSVDALIQDARQRLF